MSPRQRAYYQGIPLAPYDLVIEGLIGLLVVGVLVVGLSVALSSPDDPPLTVQHVATTAPLVFVQTALGELNGSDSIDSYGPPYNSGSGSVQSLGPVSLQRLAGVHIPINTTQDMVLGPLGMVGHLDPRVARAVQTFTHASLAQQARWEAAYGVALAKAQVQGQTVRLPRGAYGPVAPMMTGLLNLGRAGLLEPAVDNTPRDPGGAGRRDQGGRRRPPHAGAAPTGQHPGRSPYGRGLYRARYLHLLLTITRHAARPYGRFRPVIGHRPSGAAPAARVCRTTQRGLL